LSNNQNWERKKNYDQNKLENLEATLMGIYAVDQRTNRWGLGIIHADAGDVL
jgi:hypothetical protein